MSERVILFGTNATLGDTPLKANVAGQLETTVAGPPGGTEVDGVQAIGEVATANPVQVGGIDGGGFVTELLTEADGRPIVSVPSLPLPAGAATEATLATLGTEATLGTLGTEATLATRLADATLTARLGLLGQAAMAGSAPVVIASDQSAIPVATTPDPASSSSVTSVAQNAASVTLIAANSARRTVVIFNDASSVLYVKWGATASTSSYTQQLQNGESMSFDGGEYSGVVDGIWAGAGAGNARVTETT